ncbi:phosphate/phosphite/phosphonate ABC transporter substrate-binding protein [Halorubrum tebenquichense]|uniref:Phosphonate ABC transporter periplasmic phosphonate-binding protein n=1 Tax=Halorubrum tebenquichense DSM 14210 TaxID=1227485 RepID=M0DXJ0_9EURY|nr:phosphate/phosphite/phosphonate ABC transporter substrate-binding protein [Halorubrum tebenquichense]ELZ38809.1 phosphonate ABC transporter periplasmic phosphonate-binding protein [Halorubrum tebenquichense DSM 14210]
MVEDTDGGRESSFKRRVVLAGGAAAVTALAGCSGGSGGGGGDGSDASATTSSAGSDGSESDASGDPLLADASEFDPENPNWEENNYLSTPLIDAGYERGTRADLESMGNREVDEVPHGEPVRETPEDESEWLEPDTLVFTESPSEDVQGRYEEDFQAVFDRIEEETGIPVEYNRVNSYAASVEAMRSERAHIANFSTGTTCFAVNLAGAVPFAAGIAPNGSFGYRLFATTRADADGVQGVEDFASDDVRMAHAEPASNSGHQAPSALFDQYFDVTAGDDYEINFSGGHSQTTRGIAAGDYDAGPICSTCFLDTVEADSSLRFDDFKVVWASNPFPNGPITYRYNLHPDIQEGIRAAWLDSDFAGTAYAERTGYEEYVPIEYRRHWYDIMVIQRYNDVEYTQGALSE